MDLGAKFSFVTRSDAALYPFKSGFVFPDVHISFRIADAAVLQAAATGGDRLNSYDSLLERNPYLGSFLWHRDVTVERFNIMAGLRGSAAGRFSYDLRAGYQLVSNEFGWSYYNNGELSMAYVSPLSTIYGQLQLGWNSEHWDVSAFVKYGYTPMPTLETEVEKNVFAPASFRGNGHVFYKWGGRRVCLRPPPGLLAQGRQPPEPEHPASSLRGGGRHLRNRRYPSGAVVLEFSCFFPIFACL